MGCHELYNVRKEFFTMPTTTEPQKLELLSYKTAEGNELVALAVEFADDPNGGVQVRVLADSNVVSGVTVVPLRQSSCCG